MHSRTFAVAAGMVALAALPFAAQERTSPDAGAINARIRQEGMDHSQIMRTLHYLSDVYGPRLTGSPNHKAAAEWAVKQMTEWGMTNGHLEPWDFGREGWSTSTSRSTSPLRTKTRLSSRRSGGRPAPRAASPRRRST